MRNPDGSLRTSDISAANFKKEPAKSFSRIGKEKSNEFSFTDRKLNIGKLSSSSTSAKSVIGKGDNNVNKEKGAIKR